jgi:hypothetical protein
MKQRYQTDCELFKANYSTIKRIHRTINMYAPKAKVFIVTNPVQMLAEKYDMIPVGLELDFLRTKYSEKKGLWILKQKGYTNWAIAAEMLRELEKI